MLVKTDKSAEDLLEHAQAATGEATSSPAALETGVLTQEELELAAVLMELFEIYDPWSSEDARSWTKSRSDYWKAIAAAEFHVGGTGRFSEDNILRMLEGYAPRMWVKVQPNKGGRPIIREVSMELHHKYLPQSLKTPIAHEAWNLVQVTPWEHEQADVFRHTGYVMVKIINGLDTY